MPRPKRTSVISVRRILVCAALGIATTLAVAWTACIIETPDRLRGTRSTYSVSWYEETLIDLVQLRGATTARRSWVTSTTSNDVRPLPLSALWWGATTPVDPPAIDRRWGLLDKRLSHYTTDESSTGAEAAAGWPLLAVWCAVVPRNSGTTWALHADKGILIDSGNNTWDSSVARVLPFRPIWPGLAIDSAFFATLWLLTLVTIPLLRRRLRARRGLCIFCSYNLSGSPSPSCPECGSEAAHGSHS